MKKIYILGGGTMSHVRNHLSLCTPAFGETAIRLETLCKERFPDMEVNLVLTKMGDRSSKLVTNEDISDFIDKIKEDVDTKIVFFNVAMCDWNGIINSFPSGKHSERLKTSTGDKAMTLFPAEKIIKKIREGRKDIVLIGFKTTCNEDSQTQYLEGLNLLKTSSCNLVLANDTGNHRNMIITPEEAKYHITVDREEVLKQLVDMTFYRSQCTFTRSTVIAGEPVKWDSNEVFPSLREVVNYCIDKSAYKPFNGATVGHFACKIGEGIFLTSIRKSNFNDLSKNGLVKVTTDGDDSVMAYGAKPSVGGQSQRIIFQEHSDYDCIVHFHCPLRDDAKDYITVTSQREYECGSHQCGQNTSNNLKKFGNLSAVMLDNHGPNIVFNHNIDPKEVISFIENNFSLEEKTGGLVSKVSEVENHV